MINNKEEALKYFMEDEGLSKESAEAKIKELEIIKKFEETEWKEGVRDKNELYVNVDEVNNYNFDSAKNTNEKVVNNVGISQEENVYYIFKKENWLGDLFKLDKQGNILDCYACNLNNDEIRNMNMQTPKNKDEIIDILKKFHTQYNFMNFQKKLSEEIKGYPEFNEKFLKIMDPKAEQVKFSNEMSFLRTLIAGKSNLSCKLLISILEHFDIEYFKRLIEDGILQNNDNNQLYSLLLDKINLYVSKYNNLPTIKMLTELLNIPYSKEFFDDFILERFIVEDLIKEKYISLKNNLAKSLFDNFKSNKINLDEYTKELNSLNQKYSTLSINDNYNNLQSLVKEKKNEPSLYTGIKELDDNNIKLQKGKVATVVAYTGDFKTMFSTNVAYNNIKLGNNVLYLSLEISKEDMYYNFISRHSYGTDNKISHSDLKTNKMLDTDYENFDKVYDDFRVKFKSHLLILDETDIKNYSFEDMNQLLSLADTQFLRETGNGVDLIVVDHLNLFKFGFFGGNDYSVVNHWMSYFRSNSIDFLKKNRKVAVLCVCQSSREGYKQAQKDNGYSLTSIAEGNEIERASSLVISLFTNKILRDDKVVYLQVLKLRDQSFNDLSFYIGIEPEYYTFGVNNKSNQYNMDLDYSKYEKNIETFEEAL